MNLAFAETVFERMLVFSLLSKQLNLQKPALALEINSSAAQALHQLSKSPAEVAGALQRAKVSRLICIGKCHRKEALVEPGEELNVSLEERRPTQKRLMNCFGN